MNKILLTAFILALIVTSAFAEAKRPDVRDAVMQNGSRIVITGMLDSTSPVWNRGFNNTSPPSPSCDFLLSDSSDGQYYDVFCITSTDQSPIEIIVDPAGTTIGDTHMELYCDPFDPNTPLVNAVFSDDDDGDGLLSAFLLSDGLVLTPGTQYWLVLTTFSAGDQGTFALNTSDNVVLCGGVATESQSWSQIKGLYR
ncbi:MAG: hypothetical protein R3D98_09180 [Candidatus Krumholzibacteriia bacterium]